MLSEDDIVLRRFRVEKRIGEGTFSTIYKGLNLNTREYVALKIEKPNCGKTMLNEEHRILKDLQTLESPYICKLTEFGTHHGRGVLVMQLLGSSISDIRRRRESTGGMTSYEALNRGISIIRALRSFHASGYVHRDVKPSNFLVPNDVDDCMYHSYIVDFGLARKHVAENDEVIPARSHCEFRGTSLYASVTTHDGHELGRRDDLWSALFVVLDMISSTGLPWRGIKDNRDRVRFYKNWFITDPTSINALPLCLQKCVEHLHGLEYADEPDYNMIEMEFQHLAHTVDRVTVGCVELAPMPPSVVAESMKIVKTTAPKKKRKSVSSGRSPAPRVPMRATAPKKQFTGIPMSTLMGSSESASKKRKRPLAKTAVSSKKRASSKTTGKVATAKTKAQEVKYDSEEEDTTTTDDESSSSSESESDDDTSDSCDSSDSDGGSLLPAKIFERCADGLALKRNCFNLHARTKRFKLQAETKRQRKAAEERMKKEKSADVSGDEKVTKKMVAEE